MIARPDGRQVWVNFAFPTTTSVQVIDVTSARGDRPLETGQGRAAHGVHAARRSRLDFCARRQPGGRSTTRRPCAAGTLAAGALAASSSRRAARGWVLRWGGALVRNAVQRARADDFDAPRLPSAMKRLEFTLLNEFQRGFPLVPQPFRLHRGTLRRPRRVMTMLRDCGAGVEAASVPCSRRAGSALARSPPWRCRPTGSTRLRPRVSARPEVNHNYEREHRFNLWFVATAAVALACAALWPIEGEAELPVHPAAAHRRLLDRPGLRSRRARGSRARRVAAGRKHVQAAAQGAGAAGRAADDLALTPGLPRGSPPAPG